MNRWLVRIGLSAAALLLAAGASAQVLTGTITGKVTDAQGGALPGVLVTLVSRQGETTQTTDALGDFRFLGLTPGVYEVRSSLEGFRPNSQANLELAMGKTIEVKVSLQVGGVTEAVTVLGSTSKVDATTTATDTTISQDLLFAMPISRANPAVSMLNYAPGINSSSAFGGASGTANALLVDGVDVRDPEGGTPWVFFNYNIIDQVQIGSLGQAAEYGGFSGAVINTVTKSGGNKFAGLFEYRYTGNRDVLGVALRADNVSSNVKAVNPSIKATGVDSLNDYTVQLGGPMRANKAFFFGSVQRYAIKQDPDGPRTLRTEVSPRYNGKFTFQPTAADNITLSFQYDNYNQGGRTSLGGVNGTNDFNATQQDSPEWVYNGGYRRVLGNSALLEAKYTGYWGYFDLDPLNPVQARFDGESGAWTGGAGRSAQYDRTRNQLNASLSKYAEAKGTHAFKFGVEIERSTIRNRYGYTDGLYYYDYGGAPFLAYAYSYDVKGRSDRISAFAQDQWQIGRLTINGGLRMDRITGTGTSDNKQYYSVTPVAPRIGVAYDIAGDGQSVLRAYYGQLYDGAVFASWSSALPGIGDFVTYEAGGTIANTTLIKEIDRIPGASKFTMLGDLKHPRTDEISVAFERQLTQRIKATATYIRRDAKNFINSTLIGARWAPVNYTNPLNGTVETVYRWVNRFQTDDDGNVTCPAAPCVEQKFQIGNVDNFAFDGAPAADAYRTYNGGMFVLTRGFANRWQAQLSYVYSKTKGTITNGGFSGITSNQFQTPNLVHVNTDGLVGFDRTHEFKAFAGYQVPVIEVAANIYYRIMSGTPWTPFQRVPSSTFNWPTSIDLFIEPRGSRRMEKAQLLDLRLEKVVNVGENRFGLYFDAENILNSGFVTGVQTRNPSLSIAGVPVPLGGVTTITAPRQITFGGRWSF